jgi:hypothetical protein
MPPLVIANGMLVRLIWTRSGSAYAINVVGALNASAVAVNQALADSLGSAVKSAFTSSGFAARVSSTVSLSQVGIRNIAQANQAEFLDAGAAVPGTAAGAILPPQIALVLTLRTALAGASFRGRVYLPGWTEDSNNTSGACDSAPGGNARDFVIAIASALTAAGLQMAVLSRSRLVGTPITSVVLRDFAWDTVRKRATAGV